MQLATTLFGALFGGGGAAATATAATTTAATTTAAVGSSGLLKALAIGGSVVSAISSFGAASAAAEAGRAERDQLNSQADQEHFESRNEFIEGREAAASLKRRLLQTISGQATAFARGGVALNSVSVQTAKKQATEDAERELSVNANSSLAREIQRRRRASNLRQQGINAERAGNARASQYALDGVSGLFSSGMKLAEIG